MKIARAALVVMLLWVVAGHAPRAWACTCVRVTDARHFARADAVFVGTATDSKDPNAGEPIRSTGDPIAWTFDVRSVQKGDVSDPETVTTARSDASCGFDFETGERYQVFAQRDDDGMTAGLCDGTRALAAERAYFPSAVAPTQGALPPTGTDAAAPIGAGLVGVAAAAAAGIRRRRG